MVVYCLEKKGQPLGYAQLAAEVEVLMRSPTPMHPEILYRRIPLEAFKLSREALWCLVYFHHGRNRSTGLYYSRRVLSTPSGKGFRIGETVRQLERQGLLERRSAVGWYVPQEDKESGKKYPPIRASLLNRFLENPTKERWTALRYAVYLASALRVQTGYRTVQKELGCSTEMARNLVGITKDLKHPQALQFHARNLVFNWPREAPALKPQKSIQTAPILNMDKALKQGNFANSRTDSVRQYNSLKKEIQKKNPSTRPLPATGNDGFSRDAKPIEEGGNTGLEAESGTAALSNTRPPTFLGFGKGEFLPSRPKTAAPFDGFNDLLPDREDREAAQGLLEMALKAKRFRDYSADQLRRYVVDIWLELKRRKGGIKASPLGYFFTALANNLATGYCRLDQKQAEREAKKRLADRELEREQLRRLDEIHSKARRQVRAECLVLEPGFDKISFLDIERRTAIFNAARTVLTGRGDLAPFAAHVLDYCEREGSTEEHLLRFMRQHQAQLEAEINAMRHPRKAA